jgi:uncharacterized integral membrane protein
MSFDDELKGRTSDVPRDKAGPNIPLLLGIVGVILAVIFVLQNREKVQVDFLVFEINSRLWVVILIAIVIGAFADNALGMAWRRIRGKNKDGSKRT